MNRITDRREEYYGLASRFIAADPLGFYTRAERGRALLAHMRSLPTRFAAPARAQLVPEPVQSASVHHLPTRRKA